MHPRTQRALTLIELVVVLIVLVALAGIVISRFDGVLTQTHVAATTTNVPSIESGVRSKALLTSGSIGDSFDAVVVDPTGAPSVPSYMPGGSFWVPLALTADDVSALGDLGMTAIVPANAPGALTDNDATFGSHDGAPLPLAAGVSVLAMGTGATATDPDDLMLTSFNMVPAAGSRYLAFGVGSQCTLVGGGPDAIFSEAAVHFGDTAGTRSNVSYTRYFLVLELANAGTPTAEARFLGAAAPHENGLERNEAHLKEFYGQ